MARTKTGDGIQNFDSKNFHKYNRVTTSDGKVWVSAEYLITELDKHIPELRTKKGPNEGKIVITKANYLATHGENNTSYIQGAWFGTVYMYLENDIERYVNLKRTKLESKPTTTEDTVARYDIEIRNAKTAIEKYRKLGDTEEMEAEQAKLKRLETKKASLQNEPATVTA